VQAEANVRISMKEGMHPEVGIMGGFPVSSAGGFIHIHARGHRQIFFKLESFRPRCLLFLNWSREWFHCLRFSFSFLLKLTEKNWFYIRAWVVVQPRQQYVYGIELFPSMYHVCHLQVLNMC